MPRPPVRGWRPANPHKYRGDFTNIVSRSSWETRVMNWLDNAENVIEWSSEEIVIPYISPIDGKSHRYFVDFYVKFRQADGKTRTKLIEIKPLKQTKPPVKKDKVTKKYINEVVQWGINEAKWNAAMEYCKDRGWEFSVMTEVELGLA